MAVHQSEEKGHKSVTLMTTLFVSGGKKGGLDRNVFSNVRLKHLPQPGPYEVLLPKAI